MAYRRKGEPSGLRENSEGSQYYYNVSYILQCFYIGLIGGVGWEILSQTFIRPHFTALSPSALYLHLDSRCDLEPVAARLF